MSGKLYLPPDTVDFSYEQRTTTVDNEQTRRSQTRLRRKGPRVNKWSFSRSHHESDGDSCRCECVLSAGWRGGGYKPQMQESPRQDCNEEDEKRQTANRKGRRLSLGLCIAHVAAKLPGLKSTPFLPGGKLRGGIENHGTAGGVPTLPTLPGVVEQRGVENRPPLSPARGRALEGTEGLEGVVR